MTKKMKPEVIKRFKIRSYICLGTLMTIGVAWMLWNAFVFASSPEFSANEKADFTMVQNILDGGPIYFLVATILASLYFRIRLVKLSLDPRNLEHS
ncbi:hypothetical protein [Marinobacter sp. tcs-11]|uniref:hypothetical protein n=1 Tax=Marinobacter sp. tcs-11 TaxID=1742860 RepID=UPI00257AA2CD|nr:hypothetical protein [Marinobacter sp. tcs-11]